MGSVQTLLKMNHPREQVIEVGRRKLMVSKNLSTRKYRQRNESTVRTMVTNEKIGTAIPSLEHFEAPDRNGIYPVMLKGGIGHNIFLAVLTLSCLLTSCQNVKVVFIPKSEKNDCSHPKNFR